MACEEDAVLASQRATGEPSFLIFDVLWPSLLFSYFRQDGETGREELYRTACLNHFGYGLRAFRSFAIRTRNDDAHDEHEAKARYG